MGGDITYRIEENLHRLYAKFEHEIGSGGGSGDSGGIFFYQAHRKILKLGELLQDFL